MNKSAFIKKKLLIKYILMSFCIFLILGAFERQYAYSDDLKTGYFRLEINDLELISPSDANEIQVTITNLYEDYEKMKFVIEPIATPGIEVYLDNNYPEKKVEREINKNEEIIITYKCNVHCMDFDQINKSKHWLTWNISMYHTGGVIDETLIGLPAKPTKVTIMPLHACQQCLGDDALECDCPSDPNDDIDNHEHFYIQSPRGGVPPYNESLYQFSSEANPALAIDYNVPYLSLVTILIFDSNGCCLKDLVNGVLRKSDTENNGKTIDFWDGRNNSGELVPDGLYKLIINGVNIQNALEVWDLSGEILIDTTSPIAELDPNNFYSSQPGYYTIRGTAADEHLSSFYLECIDENLNINFGASSIEKGVLGIVKSAGLEDGSYTIRLTTMDLAGNYSVVEMPLLIDNVSNGLKVYIDSVSQEINSVAGGSLPSADDINVWIDDELPDGSKSVSESIEEIAEDSWQWDNTIKYSGKESHTNVDLNCFGAQGHYFIHANEPLCVSGNDNIIQYVYLDPNNEPSEILLQFYTDNGDGEHRAYWGGCTIPTGGTQGTASLYYMGDLPDSGKWVRLKIPASTVGLSGKDIKGMAFVTYNGKAYWDKTVKSNNYYETQKNSWYEATQINGDKSAKMVVHYRVYQDAAITLSIYDDANTLINTLIDNEFKETGFYEISWNGMDDTNNPVSDGQYHFQITNADGLVVSNVYYIDMSAIITAEINFPYKNSLVYGQEVPIIGTASAANFQKYTMEYGYGQEPDAWFTIATSYNEVFADSNRSLFEDKEFYGRLAVWDTTQIAGPKTGTYTIRLSVYNQEGNDPAKGEVRVQIAESLILGGSISSNDGLVTLKIPYGAICDDADLFLIKQADANKVCLINDMNTIPGERIHEIYEIRPAGYQFLKPCILKMSYTEEQIAQIDENSLSIYQWNPDIESWIYAQASLDTENNVLKTTLTHFNDYEVYYAIFAVMPSAPFIFQPNPSTEIKATYSHQNISLYGQAALGEEIEVFINGVSQGTVQADENTGLFVKTGIYLDEGDYEVTSQVTAPGGNTGPLSDPVSIRVELAETADLEVSSLAFQDSNFFVELNDEDKVAIGDRVFIELIATMEADSDSIDSTMVNLKSNADPDGIFIQLLETADNSRTFRGTAIVGEISQPASGTIGISSSSAETITVTSNIDPNKQDSIDIIDIIPPPPPTITSPTTHPSLSQDTFEVDMGQWSNKSGSYGAIVERTTETASSGTYSLKLTNAEQGGDFAAYIWSESFDPRDYPLVCFDYKIPQGIRVNLIALVNGMWKEIVFTDDPKIVATSDGDLYRPIGRIDGVKADDTWRRAEFNLYTMLKNDDPNQSGYIVEEFFFADYNLPEWTEMIMGDNVKDATYYIDNFFITQGGARQKAAVFTLTANDKDITGYCLNLDQDPNTVPDPDQDDYKKDDPNSICNITWNIAHDGVWYFHARSKDSHGNWGPVNHYRLRVDTEGPVADSWEPQDQSSSSMESRIRILDSNGSGVNPDTIKLEVIVNSDTYDLDLSSEGLVYDENIGMLTFSLWEIFPLPDLLLDGKNIDVTLTAADDFAGNKLQEQISWSWSLDYKAGYLSLLTKDGGYTPTWSPDGKRIAFMSERSGNKDIWFIDANDYAELKGSAVQLTLDEASDHHPAWSPDPNDNRIVFVSDRDEDKHEHIYIINADTPNDVIPLTAGDFDDSHPTWSPDGSKISFSRDGEIWTINSNGTQESQITTDSVGYCLDPVWSPDGTQIAFTQSLYMDKIVLIDPNGRNRKVLTQSGCDLLPAWSKQSNQIIFVTEGDKKTQAIRIVNSEGGSEAEYIVNAGRWWDTEPDESLKNGKLTFQSTRNGDWNIWIKHLEDCNIPITVDPNTFSPNDDQINDLVNFTASLKNEGNVYVDLTIYNGSNNPVITLFDRQLLFEGNIVACAWDGKNIYGDIVPDGIYTYILTTEVSAGADTEIKSGVITLDTTLPTFSDWKIFENVIADGNIISVTLSDETGINKAWLQYAIVEIDANVVIGSNMIIDPNVMMVPWTDVVELDEEYILSGNLEVNWSFYDGNWLFVRAYAEDEQGNIYSEVQEKYITLENHPPVANAGLDKKVKAGDLVYLDGSGSSDPDYNLASYRWEKTAGAPVTLSEPDSLSPTFIAPGAGEKLTFKLTVTDTLGASVTDSVIINVNRLPIAIIECPKNIHEDEVVTVDGSGSFDPDPNDGIVNYDWDCNSPDLLESDIIEIDTNRGQFSFKVPKRAERNGEYEILITLKVTDEMGESSEVNCNISLIADNDHPNADVDINADPNNQELRELIDENRPVPEFIGINRPIMILDGSSSSDLDGNIVSYNWTWTQDPNDTCSVGDVYLADPNADKTSFEAPDVGVGGAELTFKLTVTDDGGLSAEDEGKIKINFINHLPVADAGEDKDYQEHDGNNVRIITLDGTNSVPSSDSNDEDDCDYVTYQWTKIAGPEIGLSACNIAKPTFSAPDVEPNESIPLTFELTVEDSFGESDTCEVIVNITWDNYRPEAKPTAYPEFSDEGTEVSLDGSGSYDPDESDYIDKYHWEQEEGDDAKVTIIDPNVMVTTFIAPDVDCNRVCLNFTLTVTDNHGMEDSAMVFVNINGIPPIADAGPDQDVVEGCTVVLDGSGSYDPGDPEGGIISYHWKQKQTEGSTDEVSVLLSRITDKKPTFIAPLVDPAVDPNGICLTFKLTVQEEKLKGEDEVSINIRDNGIKGFPEQVITFDSITDEHMGIYSDSNYGELIWLYSKDPNQYNEDPNQDPISILDPNDSGIPGDFIYGLIDMGIKVNKLGGTAKITIYLPNPAPEGYTWWKYTDDKEWCDYSDSVVFNPQRNQVTLTFVDGDEEKGDQDGRKNAKIIDPSGLGRLIFDGGGSGDGSEDGTGDVGPSGCFITTVSRVQ